MKKQIALIVLDGWGYSEDKKNNAIADAKTPFFDSLWSEYPHSVLNASEESVGLPSGQIGNSEIGHMTIGTGRVIDTDLVRITKAMNAGGFSTNLKFKNLFAHVLKNNSTLHIMGLLSPGGIHSHDEHVHGFIRAAYEAGIKKIAVHAFTDGRDVAPQSAADALASLQSLLSLLGVGSIATVSGRFYAMDRDHNWDRTEKVMRAIFLGEGEQHKGEQPSAVMKQKYAEGMFDEHLPPMVFLGTDGKPMTMQDGDGVFFFNYRPDRARQLSKYITDVLEEKKLCFVTLTEYSDEMKQYAAFPQTKIETTLAGEISAAGLSQVHIAETEKYPHATYFLNGGREAPYAGEAREIIESRKDIQTHDQAPEMRAKEIADCAIAYIEKGTDFVFINFANADMVGHSANKPAIIIAVETIDCELKRVVDALMKRGGVAFITADHGNAEQNVDPITGEKHTAHTLNLVPAILTEKGHTMKNGGLADIAPTILSLYGLPIPESMTGEQLTTV